MTRLQPLDICSGQRGALTLYCSLPDPADHPPCWPCLCSRIDCLAISQLVDWVPPTQQQQVIVVQLLSCVVTPWTAAHQASLSFVITWSSLKLVSTESMMPVNPLILCHLLLLLPSIFSNIRVFPNESSLHIRWPKYWSFSFSISPSNEYSGLISFRIDWFDPLCCPRDSQEPSSAPQLKSISSSALSLPYGPTLTSIHDYRKNHGFD